MTTDATALRDAEIGKLDRLIAIYVRAAWQGDRDSARVAFMLYEQRWRLLGGRR